VLCVRISVRVYVREREFVCLWAVVCRVCDGSLKCVVESSIRPWRQGLLIAAVVVHRACSSAASAAVGELKTCASNHSATSWCSFCLSSSLSHTHACPHMRSQYKGTHSSTFTALCTRTQTLHSDAKSTTEKDFFLQNSRLFQQATVRGQR